eukprot:scaffold1610_cov257-Pinguiococcus_pyrenoidosus.AAC.4
MERSASADRFARSMSPKLLLSAELHSLGDIGPKSSASPRSVSVSVFGRLITSSPSSRACGSASIVARLSCSPNGLKSSGCAAAPLRGHHKQTRI